jgi:SagB-type dehydrogenase family enzyme
VNATSSDAADRVLAYHERTKHRPQRYAASLGYLDWDAQPDPFRTYEAAPRVELPFAAAQLPIAYADLFRREAVPPATLSLDSLGTLFELALGITAWKRYQSAHWSLRANPSSGNLHPTESWALLPEFEGLPSGVYHYLSRDHLLERRCKFTPSDAAAVARHVGDRGFLVLLTSIRWREAWKYGERAFRYCQHDVGHALGALRMGAAALGWSAALVDDLGDERLAGLLGLDREGDFRLLASFDREHPETALWIAPAATTADARAVTTTADELVACARRGIWAGQANALSRSHVDWPAIDAVAEATRRPTVRSADSDAAMPDRFLPPRRSKSTTPAATLILGRRSAVAFDRTTSITSDTLFEMLDATLPRWDAPPWDAFPSLPRIHLGVFVHRVRDLSAGLYLLERSPTADDGLRDAVRKDALWSRVSGCPDHLRFFALIHGDLRDTARVVSCNQEIAADGAFSLGMLASFEPVVRAAPHEYRRLFWEAGLVGQVLYLEAEAAGVRATGIGCYFDDLFHELLGLTDRRYQSMYHFTVGGPVEDPRLQTEPAYGHLLTRRSIVRA